MLDTIVKTNLSTLTDSFHNNVVKHHDDNDHADGGMVPMMLIVLVKKVIVYTSTNMHTHTHNRLSNNHSTIFAPQTFPHDDWLFLPAAAA